MTDETNDTTNVYLSIEEKKNTKPPSDGSVIRVRSPGGIRSVLTTAKRVCRRGANTAKCAETTRASRSCVMWPRRVGSRFFYRARRGTRRQYRATDVPVGASACAGPWSRIPQSFPIEENEKIRGKKKEEKKGE